MVDNVYFLGTIFSGALISLDKVRLLLFLKLSFYSNMLLCEKKSPQMFQDPEL